MNRVLNALRDLAVIFGAAVLGVCVIITATNSSHPAPLPTQEGRTLPNPFSENSYEIQNFNMFQTKDGWRVSATLLPPSMPIRVYLIVLDEELKNNLKLKDSSFVGKQIPGVGWESPVREVLIKDFSSTSRGYAATIEIHGWAGRYGTVFDLEFLDGRDKSESFVLPEGTFAMVAEKSGRNLEKSGSTQ